MNRPRSRLLIPCLLALVLAAPVPAAAGGILIDDFKDGPDQHWEPKIFAGRTQYRPAVRLGRPCLAAESNNAASGLVYTIEYDPHRYPVIEWDWLVEEVNPRGDAGLKEGDDYPARVYVIFPSFFFWRTRALNYIWANRLPRGRAVPNPFTANDIMIALQSGPDNTGGWVTERRNILEDYRRYFGEEPGPVGAIAIMTDTDNTGAASSACYGPIRVLGPGE